MSKKHRGITLVEMLMVVALMGILAAIMIPAYGDYIDRSQDRMAMQDLSYLYRAIRIYHTSLGDYPRDLDQLGIVGMHDPWGNPYHYLNHTTAKEQGIAPRLMTANNTEYLSFDLYSKGKDQKTAPTWTDPDSADDIIVLVDAENKLLYLGRLEDYILEDDVDDQPDPDQSPAPDQSPPAPNTDPANQDPQNNKDKNKNNPKKKPKKK